MRYGGLELQSQPTRLRLDNESMQDGRVVYWNDSQLHDCRRSRRPPWSCVLYPETQCKVSNVESIFHEPKLHL